MHSLQPKETHARDISWRSDPLVRQVIGTIERHQMLHPGDKVLVGVSAGPDSVVLLHVLHSLSGRFDIRLGVAHLDHGMRPEAAEAEKNLVIALAQRFGLECHVGKLERFARRGSLEEQLRERRYAFFEHTADAHNYNRIALGHHADDNAEAVLLHLLRGSGLRGLSGIPPVRNNRIVRPLIEVRRSDVLAYAKRRQAVFLQDASNLDPRFERNRVRHQLVPLLESRFNPNVVRTLNRTAALCREEDQWQAAYTASLIEGITHRADRCALELYLAQLRSKPRALQRRLIRQAIAQWQGHLRRIGAGHIEALLSLLEPGRLEARLHLPANLVAEITGDRLRFRRVADSRQDKAPPQTLFHYAVSLMGRNPCELRIAEACATLRFSLTGPVAAGAWHVPDDRMVLLDLDRLTLPLTVRNFKPGDWFEPFGLQGRQKLKKLFIDRKISRRQRERTPLLTSGGDILWVAGVRRGRHAALSPDTTRVLRVEVEYN